MPVPIGALSVLPSIQVLLDDGTSTFPFDITAYVSLASPLTITRGRGDEQQSVTPGTLTLTLENIDGRFTFGSTVGGYGAIDLGRGIRVVDGSSGRNLFTGFVQSWPVGWPDGSQTYATATIGAVDAMARWARRKLRNVIEEETRLDGNTAHYALGEPAGATTAADTSGSGAAVLTTAGTGAAIVFGTATGPGTDGLTAATFAAGQYLSSSQVLGGSVGTWGIYFSTTTAGGSLMISGDGVLGVNTAGKLTGRGGLVSSASVTDGATHHAAWKLTGGTATLYLDGSVIGTAAASAVTATFNIGIGFTGNIAHAYYIPAAISTARVAAHATAGSTGFDSERSDQRAVRLAGYVGTPVGASVETGATTVPFVDFTGASVDAAMHQVADAEWGIAYIDGSGALAFHNNTHAAARTTPDLSIDVASDSIDEGVTFVADTQHVLNYVTATRVGASGSLTQVATDATSIAKHGAFESSLELLVATDDAAYQRAVRTVGLYSEPLPRLPDLKLDLLTADTSTQSAAMALDLDSHVVVTGFPSQAPSATADLIVQGYSLTIGRDQWSITLNAASWLLFVSFIWDDDTFGVWDSDYPWGA